MKTVCAVIAVFAFLVAVAICMYRYIRLLRKKNRELQDENARLVSERYWQTEKEKIKAEVFGDAGEKKQTLAAGSGSGRFAAASSIMRNKNGGGKSRS